MKELWQSEIDGLNYRVLEELDQKPKPDLAASPEFCLEDAVRHHAGATTVLAWVSLMKALKGRTVRDVRWITGPIREDPFADSSRGRFIVELEPKPFTSAL